MPAKILSAREKRTLSAAAEVLIPQGGPFPYGHKDVDIVGFGDDFLVTVPKQVNQLIHIILFFVEYLGWLFAGWPSRFSKAKLEKRMKTLDGMRHSRWFFIRGFYILLNSVCSIPFYRDPRVMDAVGYKGYKHGVNKMTAEAA
jgi:hypothetical protein